MTAAAGSRALSLLSPSRPRTRLTVAGETSTVWAIHMEADDRIAADPDQVSPKPHQVDA